MSDFLTVLGVVAHWFLVLVLYATPGAAVVLVAYLIHSRKDTHR